MLEIISGAIILKTHSLCENDSKENIQNKSFSRKYVREHCSHMTFEHINKDFILGKFNTPQGI